MRLAPTRKNLKHLKRRFRQVRAIAHGLQSRRHPILAHIIPMRRCNLACAYCNEFDKTSNPVPLAEMVRRVDKLGEFGTSIITISGGEPLLHPDLDEIIRAIRRTGAIATIITNGYLLTPARIQRLNRAGLEHLQISIDNVNPDEVSKKSLKVLDRKLQWLAQYAEFDVNINSVIGGGIKHPEDALTITRRALELGFETTVGIIHDHSGQLQPFKENERAIYDQIQQARRSGFWAFAYDKIFQENLMLAKANEWQCHAGSRYLYICENGLVHYCSQQRGFPGVPLLSYTQADLDREYSTVKSCAPFCTVSCVHRVAMIDMVREKPRETLARLFPPVIPGGRPQIPLGLRLLTSIFAPPPAGESRSAAQKLAAGAALKLFGAR